VRDVAYSLRILGRHPRYTVLAVLTLAAGIGVTSAMFALLDALYFSRCRSPNRIAWST
jgi:hypothetical protein